MNFQKTIIAILLALSPFVAVAQINLQQGGTGLNAIADDSILFKSSSNIRLATSSNLTFDGSIFTALNGIFTTATATTFCLTGDDCITTWPTGGGDGFSTTSADYWETQQTARDADDLTDDDLDALQNVAAMTEAEGDLLYYVSGAWNRLASSTDGLVLKLVDGFPSWATDLTGGGDGLATSTAIADTQVTYGTSASTIGSEAAFTYDDALNLLSFTNGSSTLFSATTLFGSLTGNADTATALSSNGSNCSSGNSPLGVDASGAAEGCFDVWTEAENTSAAYFPLSTWYATTSAPQLTTLANLSITESQISDLGTYLTSASIDTSAELRAILTDEVGTGAAYFVGGALGTPASGNGSNLTALNATQLTSGTIPAARIGANTIDAITEIASALKDGTGACSSGLLCLGGHTHAVSTEISGLGTNVATWLGTPSSANLASAVTGETGSGALMFGTSPTITTSFTFDSVTVTGLTGSDVNVVTGTAGTAGNCVEWDANGDIVDAGDPCGTGGSSGGGDLSTTTEKVGQGAAATTSYITDELMLGGSASTSAEFLFDYTQAAMRIASSSDATTTILSVDATETVIIGEGDITSDDGWAVGEAIAFNFQTAGDVIIEMFSSVADWVWESGTNIKLGAVQWNSGDNIDGEVIANDTIDDDSIDFVDVTLADITFDVGSVDTTEFGYLNGVTSAIQTQLDAKLESTDIDSSSELITLVTDETGVGPLVFGTGPNITSLVGLISLELPNNGTVNENGEITTDDTSGQLRYYAGGAERVADPEYEKVLQIASTTQDTALIDLASGTTTWYLGNFNGGVNLDAIYCKTDTGTAAVRVGDGTNYTEFVIASSSGGEDISLSNNAFTDREDFIVEIGSSASSPNRVVCTFGFSDVPD